MKIVTFVWGIQYGSIVQW